MSDTKLVKQINPDSIEIGTPSKGGAIKVYGDFDDVETFKDKVKRAFEVRKYANDLSDGKEPPTEKTDVAEFM